MRYFQAAGLGLALLSCMNCSHVNLNYQQGAWGKTLQSSRVLTPESSTAPFILKIEPSQAILRIGQFQDFEVSLQGGRQTQLLSPDALDWQISAPQIFSLQRSGRGQALNPGQSRVKVQLKNQPQMQAYSQVQILSNSATANTITEGNTDPVDQAETPTPQIQATPTPGPLPEPSSSGSEPLNPPPSGPPVPERPTTASS